MKKIYILLTLLALGSCTKQSSTNSSDSLRFQFSVSEFVGDNQSSSRATALPSSKPHYLHYANLSSIMVLGEGVVKNDYTPEKWEIPTPTIGNDLFALINSITTPNLSGLTLEELINTPLESIDALRDSPYEAHIMPFCSNEFALVKYEGQDIISMEVEPLFGIIEVAAIKAKIETGTDLISATYAENQIVSFRVIEVSLDGYPTQYTLANGAYGEVKNAVPSLSATDNTESWSLSVDAQYKESADPEFASAEVNTEAGEIAYRPGYEYNEDIDLYEHTVIQFSLPHNSTPPRLNVMLTDIMYRDATGAVVELDRAYSFLSVTSYGALSAINKGIIYRVGGTEGITFSLDNLRATPYSANSAPTPGTPAPMNMGMDVEVESQPIYNQRVIID